MLKIVKSLLELRCERDLVCNSGHLLSWPRNRCCIYYPSLAIGRCFRVKTVPKNVALCLELLHVHSSVFCFLLNLCVPFLIFGSVLHVCCAGLGWLITWWTARWLRRPWAPVPTKTITKPVWPPTHGSSVSFFECLREENMAGEMVGKCTFKSHNKFVKFQVLDEINIDGKRPVDLHFFPLLAYISQSTLDISSLREVIRQERHRECLLN